MNKYEKPGKPVTHNPVVHVETGIVYNTYTEAAKAINGNRWGVRFTAMHIQKSHMGQHFEYTKKKKSK